MTMTTTILMSRLRRRMKKTKQAPVLKPGLASYIHDVTSDCGLYIVCTLLPPPSPLMACHCTAL